MDDMNAVLIFVLRWIHILAGITWIGHLYFFNFVNVPFQGALDKELKPRVNPALLPRALWWFRWGAMTTFVVGLLLLMVKYGHSFEPGQGLWVDADGALSQRAKWILFGALLGTIMWFNVWFVIWPAQKQIITWVKGGQAPPEMPALAKKALTFSRINTYLSGPMLFGMIAPNNWHSFGLLEVLIVTVVGVGIIHGMIKMSYKVGTDI
jgi:uncharacterized membrane protein